MMSVINYGSVRTVWFKRVVIDGEIETETDVVLKSEMLPEKLQHVSVIFNVDKKFNFTKNKNCYHTFMTHQFEVPFDLPKEWDTADRDSIDREVLRGIAIQVFQKLADEGYQYVHNLVLRQSGYMDRYTKAKIVVSGLKISKKGIRDGKARLTGS